MLIIIHNLFLGLCICSIIIWIFHYNPFVSQLALVYYTLYGAHNVDLPDYICTCFDVNNDMHQNSEEEEIYIFFWTIIYILTVFNSFNYLRDFVLIEFWSFDPNLEEGSCVA